MASSVSGVIHADRTLVFDRNANYVGDSSTYGLAMKYIITPDSNMSGYNIEIYTSLTFKYGMYSTGGKKKLYIEINGTEQPAVEYGSGEYGYGANKLTVDILNANGTTKDPTEKNKWFYANTYHINGTNGLNSVTLKARLEHYTVGADYSVEETSDGTIVHRNDDGSIKYTFNSNTCKAVYKSDGTLNYVCFKNSSGGTVALGPWISANGWDNPQFFHQFESCETAETVDLTSIPLATTPSITNLANNNKYNSQAGVSASTNSISLTWTNSTGSATPTKVEMRYKVSGGSFTSWSNIGVASSKTLSNLSARTTYVIELRSTNSAGTCTAVSITVRTRSGGPTLTLSTTTVSMEQVTFAWTSNYGLSSLKYKIGSNSNVSISITDGATSGSFTIKGLAPGTKYTVTITGVETLDEISNTTNNSLTTLAITKISDPSSVKHSGNIVVLATKPSYPSDPAISTSIQFIFGDYTITKSLNNSSNTYTLTEAEWDSIYKEYGLSNNMTVKVVAITSGVNTYKDEHNMTLKFTGIQKTAHVGGSDNKPKRAQIWVPDSNKVARRAVAWVGSDNKTPRRTI